MTTAARAKRSIATDSVCAEAPGLFAALARSSAALAGYRDFSQALEAGVLSERDRVLIGLMVAQRSGSEYWLSVQAHTGGLSLTEVEAAREGEATTQRDQALLFLSGKLVVNQGELSLADIDAIRLAGLTDAEMVETIGQVALNLNAVFVGNALKLELDFPSAPRL